ncbi:MAG: hypothetical protein ETSY2_19430 [Candidatus Entotheonella gemina]|uniref:Uncharacterized protein n=1 Tax=Candidatus Entotheonella gemina TaxID=1429439 RepID=W4M7Y1_9BACT|nr:MAG: hypothetical protein ETSY2_19430 [Candidatus Entotheonella gemina]
MGIMQEVIMDTQSVPSTQNMIVCLIHSKRLHNCVWQSMTEAPTDMMRVARKPCDQCLSEETDYDTEALDLFNDAGSVAVS